MRRQRALALDALKPQWKISRKPPEEHTGTQRVLLCARAMRSREHLDSPVMNHRRTSDALKFFCVLLSAGEERSEQRRQLQGDNRAQK